MTDKIISLDDFLKAACFVLAVLVAIVGVWLWLVYQKAKRQGMEDLMRSMGTMNADHTFKLIRHNETIKYLLLDSAV